MRFAMTTGRPHLRGDVLAPGDEDSTRLLSGNAIFAAAHRGKPRDLVLFGGCRLGSRTDGVSRGDRIRWYWVRSVGPVTMWAATGKVYISTLSRVSVDEGGEFVE